MEGIPTEDAFRAAQQTLKELIVAFFPVVIVVTLYDAFFKFLKTNPVLTRRSAAANKAVATPAPDPVPSNPYLDSSITPVDFDGDDESDGTWTTSIIARNVRDATDILL